ncbi:putative Methyltransferase-like protein 4 [Hypsibius exemplaris]|uniref:Methyltransferase-like protein 4 n=1 Tax=Hypsibius exemplaris TaxID=2072580 RepID=A0A1W0WS06_HYPEX|nr:putative Methyltransferase-like protein 4 [Hypsibius exemplaris]
MTLIKTGNEEGFYLDHNQSVRDDFIRTFIPLDCLHHFTSSQAAILYRPDSKDASLFSSAIQTKETRTVHLSLSLKSDMFAIDVPFMMDSEFQARLRRIPPPASSAEGLQLASESKSRKRKSSKRLSSSADDPELAELTIKFTALVNSHPEWWTPRRGLSDSDNNLASRGISKLYSSIPFSMEQGKMFTNPSDTATVRRHGSSELYVIPPHTRYICSTFAEINCLSEERIKYDLILMDPPWENKSAKRLRTYDYLSDAELLKTPVEDLAAEGALIAVWVTNNDRLRAVVETEFFPAWGLVKEAEWTWVKVTRSGEPVYSVDSLHKKPYEKLVFGRRVGKRVWRKVPDGLVFVSVPSAIHSHKPNLSTVLKPYLAGGDGARCLELFARSLTSGWTSWGLEVLRLQNSRLFQVDDRCEVPKCEINVMVDAPCDD